MGEERAGRGRKLNRILHRQYDLGSCLPRRGQKRIDPPHRSARKFSAGIPAASSTSRGNGAARSERPCAQRALPLNPFSSRWWL